MPKQPRKHHYVPRFYPAGFTDNGTPGGRLYVLDKVEQRQWLSTSKDTGCQKDYHLVDLGPGIGPMGVEKKLAPIEGRQRQRVGPVARSPCLRCGLVLQGTRARTSTKRQRVGPVARSPCLRSGLVLRGTRARTSTKRQRVGPVGTSPCLRCGLVLGTEKLFFSGRLGKTGILGPFFWARRAPRPDARFRAGRWNSAARLHPALTLTRPRRTPGAARGGWRRVRAFRRACGCPRSSPGASPACRWCAGPLPGCAAAGR